MAMEHLSAPPFSVLIVPEAGALLKTVITAGFIKIF